MATTIPGITAPPTVPSRDDPTNFDARADAFLGWLESPFSPEINAAIVAINTVATEIEQLKTDTQGIKDDTDQIKTDTGVIKTETDQIKTDTQVLKNETEAVRDDVYATANVTVWDDTTTYQVGETVSGSDGFTYRALTINVNEDPVPNVSGYWVSLILTHNDLAYRLREVNFTAERNRGYLVNIPGGSGEITLPDSSLLNDGDEISFADGDDFSTNMIKVMRGSVGQKIGGEDDDMTVDTDGARFRLIYLSSTDDWIVGI